MPTEQIILKMRRLLQEIRPLEEREAEVKKQLKIDQADKLIELFPQGPDLDEMRKIYAEFKAELGQRTLDGEDFEGMTTTATKKQVEIFMDQAVLWAWGEDKSWLMLTPEAVKMIEDAVKNRKYEVPPEVARYTESKTAIVYAEKILNPKWEA